MKKFPENGSSVETIFVKILMYLQERQIDRGSKNFQMKIRESLLPAKTNSLLFKSKIQLIINIKNQYLQREGWDSGETSNSDNC